MAADKYFNRLANRAHERGRHHEADIMTLLGKNLGDQLNATSTSTTVTNNESAGQSGAAGVCGRLSASATEPLWTGNIIGATSVYLHPWQGNVIELYDSDRANWVTRRMDGPIQHVISGTFTGTAPFDVFAYWNETTEAVALEAVLWAGDSARAVSLDLQNGVYVKAGDPTRRYIGSALLNGSAQVNDTSTVIGIWNYYNRVARQIYREDTSGWAMDAGGAPRALAGNATDNQLTSLVGVADQKQQIESWIYGGADSQESQSTAGLYLAVDFTLYSQIGIDSSTVDSSDYGGPYKFRGPRITPGGGETGWEVLGAAWGRLAHSKIGRTTYYPIEDWEGLTGPEC